MQHDEDCNKDKTKEKKIERLKTGLKRNDKQEMQLTGEPRERVEQVIISSRAEEGARGTENTKQKKSKKCETTLKMNRQSKRTMIMNIRIVTFLEVTIFRHS